MRKIIIIIAAVILLTGCKVTKQSSAVSESKTETKADVTDVVKSESKTNTVINTFVNYNDSEVANENIIITEFSVPDSAGKQFVVKTTKINRNKSKQNKSSKIDNIKQLVESQKTEEKTDKSTIKTKENLKKQTNTITKTKTPGWVYPVAILLVLGVFLFIYLILKRYKIL